MSRPAREGQSASPASHILSVVLVALLVAGCVSLSASAPDPGDEERVAALVAAESGALPSSPSPSPTGEPSGSPAPPPMAAATSGGGYIPAGASAAPGRDASSRMAPSGTASAPPSAPAPTLVTLPSPSSLVPSATPSATAVASATAVTTSERTERPVLDRATRRRLDRVLRNMVRNRGVAGLQAVVRLPGGKTWRGTAGNAQFQPDRPIRNDTAFAIASVTKTFIAALILQLAEEGKLGLDETFGTYERDAPRGRKVTIRQLLSHTSGIYNYFEHPRYIRASGAWLRASPTGVGDRDHRWTYEEILDLLRPGYCKPGGCYHYSNTNYVILGRVAEAAGGAPLHEQLRERFFEPLGLKDTYFQPQEVPAGDVAHGHWPRAGGGHTDHTRGGALLPFMAAVSAADAAGAIASTATDLATWAEALYGGRVLSRTSLRQMTTFLSPGTYGLGTDLAVFAGHRAVGHRGGLRGFEASMWHFPQSGVSIALLSNQGNWITDVPMERLVKAVLGDAGRR